MLTINNKELRNLEEQVLKNKQDIAKHYEIDRTLANFGIKIVGTVTDVNDLPNPLYYEGEYGDGYAVGDPGSYTYYLFTRPDPNAGIAENHWLDVGQLAIQGPQGPVGPEGPQGPRGEATMWYTSSAEAANGKPGDLWLDRHGWVYKKSKEENVWTSFTNIKGPQGLQGPRGIQGEQGPQGEKGDKGNTGEAGKFITIAGAFNESSQLPRPSQIKNLSLAYLVGTSEPYNLWIQVGEDSDTAIWENMGPFNVATAVTVGGQYRSTWNADTKLDKFTEATGMRRLYGVDPSGNQYIAYVMENASQVMPGWVATYRSVNDATSDVDETVTNPGRLITGSPVYPSHAANKKYVDDRVKGKLDRAINVSNILYGTDEYGDGTAYYNFDSDARGWTMVYRNGNGTASIKDPIEPLNIANKKYVDDLVGITKTEYSYNFINGYSNKQCDVKIYKQRNQLNIIVAGQLNINPDAFTQSKVQTIIEFTLDEETSRKLFVGASNTAAGNIATIPGTYYNDQNYQTTVVPFIIRRTADNGNTYWIRFTGSELTNASTITDVNIRLSLPLD